MTCNGVVPPENPLSMYCPFYEAGPVKTNSIGGASKNANSMMKAAKGQQIASN